MLEEVLRTVSLSPGVSSSVVVSADAEALRMAERFGAEPVREGSEAGVNAAVALADAALDGAADATLVLPQDAPFVTPGDIDLLRRLATPRPCVVVVPSRRLDGTNALLRAPPRLMRTHYDEDSYRIHLDAGRRAAGGNASLVLARRVMMDIDDEADVRYCLARNEKPALCGRIAALMPGLAP